MLPATCAPGVDEALQAADIEIWPEGSQHIGETRVLFTSDDPAQSLITLRFAPNYIHRRHSHDSDCLYYFVWGSGIFGARTVGPGGGVFVPADRPYKFTVGPEGCLVLEFRTARHFATTVHSESVDQWRARELRILQSAEQWRDFHDQFSDLSDEDRRRTAAWLPG